MKNSVFDIYTTIILDMVTLATSPTNHHLTLKEFTLGLGSFPLTHRLGSLSLMDYKSGSCCLDPTFRYSRVATFVNGIETATLSFRVQFLCVSILAM